VPLRECWTPNQAVEGRWAWSTGSPRTRRGGSTSTTWLSECGTSRRDRKPRVCTRSRTGGCMAERRRSSDSTTRGRFLRGQSCNPKRAAGGGGHASRRGVLRLVFGTTKDKSCVLANSRSHLLRSRSGGLVTTGDLPPELPRPRMLCPALASRTPEAQGRPLKSARRSSPRPSAERSASSMPACWRRSSGSESRSSRRLTIVTSA
jgi:hypothetical protein